MALIVNLPWIALGAVIGLLTAVCYLTFTGSVLKWKK